MTVEEIPSHNHAIYSGYSTRNNGTEDAYRYEAWAAYSQGWHSESNHGTSKVGGGNAHNNISPAVATYAWKRTA